MNQIPAFLARALAQLGGAALLATITLPLSGSLATLAATPGRLADMRTVSIGPAEASRDVREFVREFLEGSKK